ncbi:MAG: hypothetical protein II038_11015 [Lachnospiraceae bacterium]|nr:hypothetical protein [Lachnospiraceae bacterium]
MQYVYKNDPLTILPISARARHALERGGITTVGQMNEASERDLSRLRGMGRLTVREVLELQRSLSPYRNHDICYCAVDDRPLVQKEEEQLPVFTGADGKRYRNIILEDLHLSPRSAKALERYGVRYASELVGATWNELMDIPQIGARSAAEIRGKIGEVSFTPADDAPVDAELHGPNLLELAQELSNYYRHSVLFWKTRIFGIPNVRDADSLASVVSELYKTKDAAAALSSLILRKLSSATGKVSRAWLFECLPSHLQDQSGIVDDALSGLVSDNLIDVDSTSRYSFRVMTVMEYALSLEDEQQRIVFTNRINGATLLETGKRLGGFCRERIRQIEHKALANRPKLREDKYLYVFNTYYFPKDTFVALFSEPEYVYNYLVLATQRSGMKNRHLKDALTDVNVSKEIKAAISRFLNADKIVIESDVVGLSRQDLAKWLVEHRCQDAVSYGDFFKMYRQMLCDYGISAQKYGIKNPRSFENILLRQENVLTGFNRSLRFYDMHKRNFSKLISVLDFESYNGFEISSLLLFRKHPDLMEEYDIRSHYELHSLLRRISAELPESVHVDRMPTIAIGKADRYKQMLDLLAENVPIRIKNLAQLYEAKYGGDANTFSSLYSSMFGECVTRGVITSVPNS